MSHELDKDKVDYVVETIKRYLNNTPIRLKAFKKFFPEYSDRRVVQKETTFGHSKLQGMHTYDEAFFFNDKGKICKTIFEIKSSIME